jgi:hypothetical protein
LWCNNPLIDGLYERPPAKVSNDLFSSQRTTTFLILVLQSPLYAMVDGLATARLNKAADAAKLRPTILMEVNSVTMAVSGNTLGAGFSRHYILPVTLN